MHLSILSKLLKQRRRIFELIILFLISLLVDLAMYRVGYVATQAPYFVLFIFESVVKKRHLDGSFDTFLGWHGKARNKDGYPEQSIGIKSWQT